MLLNGIRVVELATYMAAPSAAALMAEWGADVIKIEPPEGCPIRQFFQTSGSLNEFPDNPVFDLDNRGKKSIALDMKKAEDVASLKLLLKEADVFVNNLRASTLKSRGLDYASIKKDFPQLIYASLTGYGLTGPDADLPGFDVSGFFARTGMTSLTGRKGEDPTPPRIAVGDHITGVSLTAGILAALLRRQREGAGCLVEASLLRAGIYALGSDMAIQMAYGRVASTKTRKESRLPENNYFRAKDKKWLVIVPRPAGSDWGTICRVIGRADLADNPDYQSRRARMLDAEKLVSLLDEAFARRDRDEWGAILDKAGIVWAPVLTPAEVVADPQTKASGAMIKREGINGAYPGPAAPVAFPDLNLPIPAPAPELNADSHILQKLKKKV